MFTAVMLTTQTECVDDGVSRAQLKSIYAARDGRIDKMFAFFIILLDEKPYPSLRKSLLLVE